MPARVEHSQISLIGSLHKAYQSHEQHLLIYHPDHLGSTSLVTNSYGEITQNISYIPYGEIFVEETAGGWQSPYYFNAKELK